MASSENRLYRVEREILERRKLDALRALAGSVSGLLAALASIASSKPLQYILVAVVYLLPYILVDSRLRGRPGYSLLRGILSYTASFILFWFSLYAALIR